MEFTLLIEMCEAKVCYKLLAVKRSTKLYNELFDKPMAIIYNMTSYSQQDLRSVF